MFKIALTLAVFAIFTSGCFWSKNNDDNQQSNDLAGQQVNQQEVDQAKAELIATYETELLAILRAYYSNTSDLTSIKEQVLALRSPEQYLGLHLKIVFILDQLEQGELTADEAKGQISELAQEYSWLNNAIGS